MHTSLRSRVALALVKKQLPKIMAADPVAALPDGLHVAIVGSGSPLPDPKRGNPCVAVIAGKKVYIVDAGEQSSETLNRMQIDAGHIETVLLTHFHSDHIGGLGSINLQRWIAQGERPALKVFGPPGVDRVVNGLNEAYALDSSYRTAHHGSEVAQPATSAMVAEEFELPAGGESKVVLEDDGLKVTTFVVDHSPVEPAVGFRFDYKGRSAVISGDTVYAPPLVKASEGADLLVHDALSRRLLKLAEDAAGDAGLDKRQQILADVWDYHATPQEAA
ncbi:MAG: MBL fold metallo-hydrolase, partial [Solirubrobacterales bacterium]